MKYVGDVMTYSIEEMESWTASTRYQCRETGMKNALENISNPEKQW